MSAPTLPFLSWRKSTRSNGNGGSNCVEVAQFDETIAIRDSKLAKGSSFPVLAVPRYEWRGLLAALREHGS